MRRFLNGLSLAVVTLMVAAFRCPGPDPVGGPERPGGQGGVAGGSGLGGSGGEECIPTADGDADQDGWTEDAGDCDDCDPSVHPGAAELRLQPGDENCNGEEDEEPACEPDTNGTVVTPVAAARVIDICDPPADLGWGLDEAHFVRADGNPIGDNLNKILPASQFGSALVPQVGNRMLVLSTGIALPGSCGEETCSQQSPGIDPPPGYPVGLPGCGVSTKIYDDVALEVTISPPPNAEGFAFHTTFLTHEYPEFVCTQFGDHFVALQIPKPDAWDTDNLIFDAAGMPPSVGFTPFPHCTLDNAAGWCGGGLDPSCPELPAPYCPAGPALLEGTGFEDSSNPSNPYPGGAATNWLKTTVPLASDEPVKIRFAIFNTGDSLRDSTALLDGFTWLGDTDLPDQPVTD
jgi:Putative metal-binding motif